MFVKEIRYTDYNGIDRSEKFYFNLNKSELTEMDLTTAGGMKSFIERITNTQDQAELIKLFKELILKAYGQKSDDGKRFIKTQQLRDEFEQTEAFSELYVELATDEKAATDFVNGVIPPALFADVQKEMANRGVNNTADLADALMNDEDK
jgi:hypothetical protein